MRRAREDRTGDGSGGGEMAHKKTTTRSGSLSFRPIGRIRSPYKEWAPYQPVEQEEGIGKFQVRLHARYARGLKELERFAYVILVFCFHKVGKRRPLRVTPPWTDREVGLFASRSPNRPNPIGISIVRIHRIKGNVVYTWPIDVFDGTPLLDLKPYIATLDGKTDADDGWIEGLEGKQHLLDHVRGVRHRHSHEHGNEHGHDRPRLAAPTRRGRSRGGRRSSSPSGGRRAG